MASPHPSHLVVARRRKRRNTKAPGLCREAGGLAVRRGGAGPGHAVDPSADGLAAGTVRRMRAGFPSLRLFAFTLGLATLAVLPSRGQAPVPPPSPAAPTEQATAQAGAPVAPHAIDPHAAWREGRYEEALQGFLDRQVERPDDPEAALNVGSAQYKLENYGAAERAFESAAAAANGALRQQALYNLGNTAYRQGRLEEAVEHYRKALELTPEDGDSKFNLEFVKREIQRRRQQEQQQDQRKQEQQEQQGEQKEGQSSEQQEPQGQQGEQGEQQERQEQQEQQGQQGQQGDQGEQGEQGQQAGSADRDGDGLPDHTETTGANPTDPDNPDTDGDGLPDGQEDADHNGRVDPGETNPNRADSDGDGIPDGAEVPAPEQGAPAQGATGEAPSQPAAGEPREMTLEEAERYLAALQEGRPDFQRSRKKRAQATPEKDW